MARILVIEDDEHIWNIIQYKLKSENHEPIWANDGLKAVKGYSCHYAHFKISGKRCTHWIGIGCSGLHHQTIQPG